MDDRADICSEIHRTGCFAMAYDARDYPQDTSGAIQVLTDYIWSAWNTGTPTIHCRPLYFDSTLARGAEAVADAGEASMPAAALRAGPFVR